MADFFSTTQTGTLDLQFAAVMPALSDVAGIAQTALDNALDFCAQKMRLPGPHAVADHLRQGDHRAVGYCQYGLARQVAEYLAAMDQEISAVYMYDYDATPEDVCFAEGTPAPLVHLIARVGRKTSGLNSLVAGLDRALTQGYAELIGRPDLAHVLDVQVVDETDVLNRTGYGALLSSLHMQPMQIWKR